MQESSMRLLIEKLKIFGKVEILSSLYVRMTEETYEYEAGMRSFSSDLNDINQVKICRLHGSRRAVLFNNYFFCHLVIESKMHNLRLNLVTLLEASSPCLYQPPLLDRWSLFWDSI